MDEKYSSFGSPLTKLIEECSEVIQISCKIQRFGAYNYHPDDKNKTLNYVLLQQEIKDLKIQIESIESLLSLMGCYK